MMASMLLMYLIVTIFPTLYFVHTVNPVHGTAGHLMAGKLLIWDTTVCWTAATECYCSISLNRTKELETNLCEDLTITEKAPKYTNEAISWHWKLCGGLLQALPFSTIQSASPAFLRFFLPTKWLPLNQHWNGEWNLVKLIVSCLHPPSWSWS